MHKLLLVLIIAGSMFTACSSVKEQQKQDISFEKTEDKPAAEYLTRSVSEEEYQALLARYEENDTTLTLSDYNALYYGQADQEGFSGYGISTAIQDKQLNEILSKETPSKEDWAKAFKVCKNIAKQKPFNIVNKFYCFITAKRSGDEVEANKWLYKHNRLVDVIMSSGDGKSAATALKVMNVRDEYDILEVLGLKFERQALIFENDKPYDVMSVAENEYGIDKVYFDISSFFGKF